MVGVSVAAALPLSFDVEREWITAVPDPSFETVFDITTEPYCWYFPAIGLLFVAVFAAVSYYRRHERKRLRRWGPRFPVGLAAFWTSCVFAATFAEWYGGRRVLRQGNASVVDGSVENFVPMPVQGHADESFSVRGIPFHYSDYTMSSAFKNSQSHGGPIRMGLHVRIHYLGNTILKLEVAKGTPDR